MTEERETEAEWREAFSRRMADILNAGAVNLAMAIGYRTRLFDVMDEMDRFAGSAEIAEAAGLDERYVREWLAVMATARVVDLASDGNAEKFRLPKAHGDFLTRRAGNANMGVYAQEIPLLTRTAYDAVTEAFTTGEGIPYERYPRFQAFMSELGNMKHRQTLVDVFLPSVDGGRLVERLRGGIDVLDLGCGEGVATRLMAEAFPKSRFVGLDLDEPAIQAARAVSPPRSNLRFELRDAAHLKDDPALQAAFDYVAAFDAVHDQTRPLDILRGVRHLLRPGGCFSMVDIAAESGVAGNMEHPMGPMLYTVSLMHCMPVGRMDGGPGLGTMWGRQKAEAYLREAGFAEIWVQPVPEDPFNLHFLAR
ncbi:MAG: class I SAM-dependent methyltransferase [Desulfococcaceae bacterium]